jgi:hypothetical protein
LGEVVELLVVCAEAVGGCYAADAGDFVHILCVFIHVLETHYVSFINSVLEKDGHVFWTKGGRRWR